MTGFPGETEAEYEETRRLITRVGFAKLHVFPYSPREGTKAAAMPGQLSNAEKERRARELIALGEETARAYRQRWIGRDAPVLVEERLDGRWLGYTPEYIQVTLPDCPACRQGQVVVSRLTAVTADGMTGVPL